MRRGPRCPACGWREDVFMLSKDPEMWVAGCPMCMRYMRGRTMEDAHRAFVEYCGMAYGTEKDRRKEA